MSAGDFSRRGFLDALPGSALLAAAAQTRCMVHDGKSSLTLIAFQLNVKLGDWYRDFFGRRPPGGPFALGIDPGMAFTDALNCCKIYLIDVVEKNGDILHFRKADGQFPCLALAGTVSLDWSDKKSTFNYRFCAVDVTVHDTDNTALPPTRQITFGVELDIRGAKDGLAASCVSSLTTRKRTTYESTGKIRR